MTFDAYDDIYQIAKDVYIEIRSIRNGSTGTSWVGEKIRAVGWLNISCKGAHIGGSDQTSLTAGDAGGAASAMARGAAPSGETTTPVTATTVPQPTTTTTTQSTTTTTTTTAPTSATATTTAPQSTTTSATSATNPTTTTTSEESTTAQSTTVEATTTTSMAAARPVGAQESPSGTYVAGKSGTNAVVQDSSGEVVFSRPVSEDATVQWDSSNDTLWIVDNRTIYRVTAGTWSAVPVDPTSATVPAKIAALIK
ncbi:hypothetical protein P9209_27520 [Prescottella defluvii]|nr:hypothetical protein P9209_27520 [Prescottella defluvii]